MPDPNSGKFILAVIFTAAILALIVVAFTLHLLNSSRQLTKARRFSNALMEFTPALMLLIFDKKNTVVAFSKNEEILKEYAQEKIIGKNARDLTFLPAIFSNEFHTLPHGKHTTSFRRSTATLPLSDGSKFFVEWQIKDFQDEDGNPSMKIALGLDITELQLAQEKLRALAANLSIAEDRERKRIAEELHDQIGETLITCNRKIANIKSQIYSEETIQELYALNQTIQQFMKGTRSLIFDLIPPVLYDIGLEAAIETLASRFKKDHLIKVTVVDDKQEKTLNHDMAMFLYKAVREFLINIVKHAQAKAVHISLKKVADSYCIVVEDNGMGFSFDGSRDHQKKDSGFGLFNIKNQVEHFGGSLDIESISGEGSKFSILMPLTEKTMDIIYESN